MAMDLPPVHSRSKNGTPLYEKRCACGTVSIVDKRRIEAPCHRCAMRARRTHGLTVGSWHPLYRLLQSMRVRCEQPSGTHYAYYGGRGIRVCDDWRANPLSFVAWCEANGWRKGMEIDRIDVNGPYAPDNCRLTSHRENSQRTRRIRTTPEQVRAVRAELARGAPIKAAAREAGVTYMVAWHIKNNPAVWSNV